MSAISDILVRPSGSVTIFFEDGVERTAAPKYSLTGAPKVAEVLLPQFALACMVVELMERVAVLEQKLAVIPR